jgi:hypothetical protein
MQDSCTAQYVDIACGDESRAIKKSVLLIPAAMGTGEHFNAKVIHLESLQN